jgi:hypothetical protein
MSFGAICCVATTCAGLEASAEAMPPVGELPAACRAAKAQFRPLTKNDLDQAKTELLQAIDRLDQRLTSAGQNGEAWRKYLQWGALQAEIQRPQGPNLEILKDVRDRCAADHEGLELVWFLDAQQALRNYVGISNAVGNPQAVKAEYEKHLDTLAARLEAYAAKPLSEDALIIGDVLRWLDDARQAPKLVRTIRHYYVKPNLLAQVSPGVVGAGITGPVDDTMPVHDCILGTDIHGTAHTTGETTTELSPHPDLGVIDTLFFGTTLSNNVGYHGPVTIYSSGTTRLAARKRLWVDASGLSSHPAAASAVTDVDIQDIQSNKGRCMIEKMAWKKAGKQQSQGECIASRHAEQALEQRIDRQAEETLVKANRNYEDKLRRPFVERKLFPQELRFSTTPQALDVAGLEAGNSRLGAPLAPPPVVEGADMSVCLHESMINNLTADALSGRTVREDRVQATVIDLLGRLPEKMKGDDDGVPWSITFVRRQPISVTFADNGFEVTIRGAKYVKGNNVAHNMNISAAYKIEKTTQGFRAVRQGDIEVAPPGGKKGGKQIGVGVLLEKRFQKVFEKELLGDGFFLPGKWKAAGKMQPVQLVCQNGWLVVAWKRGPGEEKVAAAGATSERK